MNQEDFQIVYPNINRTMKICKFKYNILEIKLFESIRIAIYLYNENNMLIESTQLVVSGPEYLAWSNDDKYIINLIKNKIQTL